MLFSEWVVYHVRTSFLVASSCDALACPHDCLPFGGCRFGCCRRGCFSSCTVRRWFGRLRAEAMLCSMLRGRSIEQHCLAGYAPCGSRTWAREVLHLARALLFRIEWCRNTNSIRNTKKRVVVGKLGRERKIEKKKKGGREFGPTQGSQHHGLCIHIGRSGGGYPCILAAGGTCVGAGPAGPQRLCGPGSSAGGPHAGGRRGPCTPGPGNAGPAGSPGCRGGGCGCTPATNVGGKARELWGGGSAAQGA